MKKKRLLIAILCIVAILIAGVLFMAINSLGFHTGTCIVADNDSYLIVMDNSPIAMHPLFGHNSMFPDLETGDKIFIIHDGIAETYPGKTGLYFIMKLSDGDVGDVPEEIMSQLQELGWISK